MNTTEIKTNMPKLLDNVPCEEDMFEGRSHQNIADAICNTLLVHNNANIIGIDGGWGSGKSNLVGLVRKALKKKGGRHIFFIYDAWGHQDDLQRRSILEELTDQLINGNKSEKSVLNEKKWAGKLKDLLARKREVETKSVPKLSVGIIASVVMLILTPIFGVISDLIPEPHTIWKIVISALPVALGIVFVVLHRRNSMRRHNQKITLESFMSELFLVYQDKIKEDTTIETISEKEPSSREFKKWIHDIDTDLKENKLIIVFDNMDRLPAQKVQELWAVIHSFFADEHYNNIRVIVPFDRSHIISAFKSEDISHTHESGVDNQPQLPKPHISKQCYGDDFINKTFNVIYRVSPPTMSNWKLFFNEKWKSAFGESLPMDSRITQIYDLLTDTHTPRKIIAFINEFASIKQICYEHNIPDQYIALFIFGKSRIAIQPEKEIISPSYLGAMEFLYSDDIEMPKNICALYYQLHPDKAIDVIYTDRTKRALDNNTPDDIKIIKALPQFKLLLENAIARVTNVPNATIALNLCFEGDLSEDNRIFWDALYKLTKNSYPNKLEDYQKILLQKITDKEGYLKSVISEFYKEDKFNVSDFYTSITELSQITDINPFAYLINKSVEPEQFIVFVRLAKNKFADYKITCKKDELDAFISDLDVEKLKNLDVIPYIKDKYPLLSKYESSLDTKIDSNIGDVKVLSWLFERLKEVKRPVDKTIPDSNIYTLFNDGLSIDTPFYYDVICLRIARLNNFPSSYQTYFDAELTNDDDAFVEEIAKRIEFYINYGDILTNLTTMNYPLYKAVAKKLTDTSFGEKKATILTVLQNYEDIVGNSRIDSISLINILNGWINEAEKTVNKTNITSIPIRFFNDANDIDNKLVKHCKKAANEYLKEKSVAEWSNSIPASNHDSQLFDILQPNLQNYFDAINILLINYANGDIKSLDKVIVTKTLTWAINNKRALLTIFNNVRDRFCENDKMNVTYFEFYGEWLFEHSKLDGKKEVLRTIFKSEVLDDDKCISIILKHPNTMKEIAKIAGQEADNFKNKISQLLSDKYAENPDFVDFASSIGITIKQNVKNKE